MRLQLSQKWSKRLCELPETGMGYQRVDVLLKNGRRVKRVLVFNAQEVEWPDEYQRIESADILNFELSDG